MGRLEEGHRAGLQAEARVAAPPGLVDDVLQHSRGRALAQERCGRAHRLDFTVVGRQVFQRAKAGQLLAAPDAPEGDARRAQAGQIERVAALGRGGGGQGGEVFAQEGEDGGGF